MMAIRREESDTSSISFFMADKKKATQRWLVNDGIAYAAFFRYSPLASAQTFLIVS